MSAPSFAQLFRRGRYCRIGPSATDDEQAQNRLEVFAVAAIGFALKHDPEFKKNFLRKSAGLEEDTENFKLSIQAANCMDLKLENRKKGILVVVEFKIRASLEKHQDPWFKSKDEPFWNKIDGIEGYGYQFRRDYRQFPIVYYITVQQNFNVQENGLLHNDDSCKKDNQTFFLKSRAWGSVLEPNTSLEKDLVKSLGELGINELKEYLMKGVKIKNEDLQDFYKGRRVVEILLQVADKIGIGENCARKILMDYFIDWYNEDESECHLGIDVNEVAIKKLSFLYAQGITKAWYGYRSENKRPFSAEIQLLEDDKSYSKIRTWIEKEFGNSVSIQKRFYEPTEWLCVIRADAGDLGDFEWFCKILGI